MKSLKGDAIEPAREHLTLSAEKPNRTGLKRQASEYLE